MNCAHKAASVASGPDDPVFLSRSRNGRRSRQTAENVARRLKTAIKRANETLADAGIEPISERVTPHSLRRTYASLRAACGDDPVYIAEQLGHEDPTFTIRVYAKAAKRRERLSGEYLAAFSRAVQWAANGQQWAADPVSSLPALIDPAGNQPRNSHDQAIN
jgi:integrase